MSRATFLETRSAARSSATSIPGCLWAVLAFSAIVPPVSTLGPCRAPMHQSAELMTAELMTAELVTAEPRPAGGSEDG